LLLHFLMQLLSFCDSSLVHSYFTAASGLLTTPLPEWLPGNREDAFVTLLMTPEFYFFSLTSSKSIHFHSPLLRWESLQIPAE